MSRRKADHFVQRDLISDSFLTSMLMLEFNTPFNMKTTEKRISINCLLKYHHPNTYVIAIEFYSEVARHFTPMQKRLICILETTALGKNESPL